MDQWNCLREFKRQAGEVFQTILRLQCRISGALHDIQSFFYWKRCCGTAVGSSREFFAADTVSVYLLGELVVCSCL